MFLNYYSKLSFLPIYILQYINYIYSFCVLWIYQCYFEMLVSKDFNGLLIQKSSDKVILYVHSGFYELTTTINDLPVCLDLSFQTESSLFSLEYKYNNIEETLVELDKAYHWLQKRYKKITVVGSGIGCYLIQSWLVNFDLKKKINLVFLSPVVSLKIKQPYFDLDILDYRSVRRSLDNIIYIEDIDYNLFASKLKNLLVIIGRNDPFYYTSKKMTHFIRKHCRVELERYVVSNSGHAFFNNPTEETASGLQKVYDFINLHS